MKMDKTKDTQSCVPSPWPVGTAVPDEPMPALCPAIEENGSKKKAARPVSVDPGARCLDLHEAGVYLGVSYWVVRDLINTGLLPKVTLPSAFDRVKVAGKLLRVRSRGGGSLRRVLVDRADLDKLIEQSKERC